MKEFAENIGFTGMVSSHEEPIPEMYVENLRLDYTSGTTLTLNPGSCRNDTNSDDIILTQAVVNNNAVNGVNGLDTGIMANNTWYYLFIISDSAKQNATASLLSLSSINPTMPAGYDHKRRIGVIRNKVGAWQKFYQRFSNRERYYNWDENDTQMTLLSLGTAIVWTNVSCVIAIPPITKIIYLTCQFYVSASPATRYTRIRANGTSWTNPFSTFVAGIDYKQANYELWIETDSNNIIQYRNDNASDEFTIIASGFMDFLI